jgi:hypothetical protein
MFNFGFDYVLNGRRVSADEWFAAMAREAKEGALSELRRKIESLRCDEHSAGPELKSEASSESDVKLTYGFCCEALNAKIERLLNEA